MTAHIHAPSERARRSLRACFLIVVAIACATAAIGYTINAAEERSATLANEALRSSRATSARLLALQFELSVRQERICSRTNQGQPCRDLFERLSRSISPAQRHRLACLVATELPIPAPSCPPPH